MCALATHETPPTEEIILLFLKWMGPWALPVNTVHSEGQQAFFTWSTSLGLLLCFKANRHSWSATPKYWPVRLKFRIQHFLNTGQNFTWADGKIELLYFIGTLPHAVCLLSLLWRPLGWDMRECLWMLSWLIFALEVSAWYGDQSNTAFFYAVTVACASKH